MENNNEKPGLKDEIINVLETCYDPEIPVNIYQLGLIYDIDISDSKEVNVRMTLTSPMCPVAGTLPAEVENKIKAVPGVTDAKVEVVWEPQWNPGMMSEVAKFELGFL
jgi:FeS assembly SUF system protein